MTSPLIFIVFLYRICIDIITKWIECTRWSHINSWILVVLSISLHSFVCYDHIWQKCVCNVFISGWCVCVCFVDFRQHRRLRLQDDANLYLVTMIFRQENEIIHPLSLKLLHPLKMYAHNSVCLFVCLESLRCFWNDCIFFFLLLLFGLNFVQLLCKHFLNWIKQLARNLCEHNTMCSLLISTSLTN